MDKKQVRFDTDEELGDNPILPLDLTTFPAGGTAEEQDNAPSPSTPFPMDPLWLPPSKGPQCHPNHTGGAHPKVPIKPSPVQLESQSWLKGMLDLVSHPSQWIQAEMDRLRAHPCCWKQIRAIRKFAMGSSPRGYTKGEVLNEPKALYYA